jgi:hypothetical protein
MSILLYLKDSNDKHKIKFILSILPLKSIDNIFESSCEEKDHFRTKQQ